MLFLDVLAAEAPDLAGETLGHVLGQAQHLANVAHRAARPKALDHGHDGRAVATIGLEDPLHHRLAAGVLEIDVDVRRLVAFGADEALEQQVVALGVDAGDAQHVTDRRIGRRAATLAQDVLAAGIADDGIDRQEVGRIAELADQPQFVVEDLADFRRHAVGEALGRALPGQAHQGLLGCLSVGDHFARVLVAEFG